MDATQEQWRPVVGYEGSYEVSDRGRVRSLSRVVMRANGIAQSVRPRLMKLSSSHGYLSVRLADTRTTRLFRVHQLVASAFLGPYPVGHVVRHLDDDKSNCTVQNLAYGTQSDNMHDASRNGLNHNREKSRCPRGHLLAAPNLRAAGKRRGCKACHRADGWMRKNSARTTRDRDAVADWKYDEIMEMETER